VAHAGADAERISDLFAVFGPVTVKRMFSGAGIYHRGTIFALCIDDVIYFKADEQSIPAFEREGLGPFTYTAKNRGRVATSYWRMPERLYDDPDELAEWANEAVKATLRSAAAKPRRAGAKSKTRRMPKA
jgi:DNA transformation protein